MREAVREMQKWERENRRAYRKRRWQKKTLAQKIASIWLQTLGWTVLLTTAFVILGVFVIFELDSKIPMSGRIIAMVAVVVLGISWWALEQD